IEAEIEMKPLQFDRVPQSVPGTREDTIYNTIYNTIPKLRESSLDALPHSTDRRTLLGGFGGSTQKQSGVFDQPIWHAFPAAPAVRQAPAPPGRPGQTPCRTAVLGVGWGPPRPDRHSVWLDERVHFEAEKPAFLGLPEPRARFPQEPDPTVPERRTNGNRLARHPEKFPHLPGTCDAA